MCSRFFPITVFAMIALSTGCGESSGSDQQAPQMPPAQVSVSAVIEKQVTEWDEFNGRIEAIETIELRPRVSGYLESVQFTEGGIVSKGDVLFTIDAREYRAAADVAKASLARAQTRAALAEQEIARSERLIAARAISAEELDQRRSEVQQAASDIASATASLSQAQLNLEFATIRAPITGRIGEALVRPGNLVSAGVTWLTTLVSVDPVHVSFEGDEYIYLKYQSQARSGERQSSREVRNPVQVGLINEEGFPHAGEMNFVDNVLNPDTGTIRGRAVLPNPDGVFTPGLFARVRLLGRGQRDALLIHDAAILTDQDRKYVYVVGGGNEAVRREIVPGRTFEGLRIVEQGLEPGDQVVVNGVRKIFFPGAPLDPVIVPMDAPFSAAPPQP